MIRFRSIPHFAVLLFCTGITHGAINTNNLLVTSWGWVFLTDFAIHKPVYVPFNNPADYNHFFHSQKNRRCYVAPERFVQTKSAVRPATQVCVLNYVPINFLWTSMTISIVILDQTIHRLKLGVMRGNVSI